MRLFLYPVITLCLIAAVASPPSAYAAKPETDPDPTAFDGKRYADRLLGKHSVANRFVGIDFPGPASTSIEVYGPKDYASSEKRYPVWYAADCVHRAGANDIFEAADYWTERGVIDGVIVVSGLSHPRNVVSSAVTNEYSGPHYPFAPEWELYSKHIAEDVVPLVDKIYRTIPDAAHRVVNGSSSRAIAATAHGWYQGDVFGNIHAQCQSSYFWVERTVKVNPKQKWLFDIGSSEDNYVINNTVANLWRNGTYDFPTQFGVILSGLYESRLTGHGQTKNRLPYYTAIPFFLGKNPLQVTSTEIVPITNPVDGGAGSSLYGKPGKSAFHPFHNRIDLYKNDMSVRVILRVNFGGGMYLFYPSWAMFKSDNPDIVKVMARPDDYNYTTRPGTGSRLEGPNLDGGLLIPQKSGSTMLRAKVTIQGREWEATSQINVDNPGAPTSAGVCGGGPAERPSGFLREGYVVAPGEVFRGTLPAHNFKDGRAFYRWALTLGQKIGVSGEPGEKTKGFVRKYPGNAVMTDETTGGFTFYVAKDTQGRIPATFVVYSDKTESLPSYAVFHIGMSGCEFEPASLAPGTREVVVSPEGEDPVINPKVVSAPEGVKAEIASAGDGKYKITLSGTPQNGGKLEVVSNAGLKKHALVAQADSGISDEYSGNTGFQAAHWVDAKNRLLIRFDLGRIKTPVRHAVLRVHGRLASAIEVKEAMNDAWDEYVVTAKNAPPIGRELAKITPSDAEGNKNKDRVGTGSWFSADITKAVEAERQGDKALSLYLCAKANAGIIESSQHPDSQIELLVYTDDPAFAGVASIMSAAGEKK